MVPIDKMPEPPTSKASVPDIKLRDPVPDPRASTTDEDITRAEGEGMLPAPAPPAAPLPARSRGKKKPTRIAP